MRRKMTTFGHKLDTIPCPKQLFKVMSKVIEKEEDQRKIG